jgi:4-amino-4-deoxy-L-arabinose transferase-like glycosyltransferase
MKTKYLYLLWFVALLPIMISRDFTPDNELRYLSIVDEALRNGTFFTFTNHGEIYADKPPLYFWLMMLGKLLFGGHRMWFLSLLSFVPAVITAIVMNKWLRKENVGSESVALLMLMTCGLFAGLTFIVRMDMLMVMFITLSLYTFYKIYKGENRKRDIYLFPLYVFLALFSKGPIGLLVPLVSTTVFLLYKKQLHTFGRYWGLKSLAVLLAGCAIWFTGVYLEGGDAYLNNLLFHQTVGRGINSFHHKEPIYYYLLSIWYALAPWSFLSIGIFVVALFKKKVETELEQFFAIIVLTTFVMLSLISSKLAVYLLPLIPFTIYLSVLLIDKFDVHNRWIRFAIALPAGIFVVALPAILYLSRLKDSAFLGTLAVFVACGILTVGGLAVLYQLYRNKETFKAIRTMSFVVLLTVFVAGFSMPKLNSYLGWSELCKKAKTLATENNIDEYWVYGIKRAENMDVYLGKEVKMIDEEEMTKNIPSDKIVLLPEKKWEKDSELRSVVESRTHYQIGNYTIVLF